MEEKKMGTLFGVSVGPGDPELMTVKAVKILKECKVWMVPSSKGEKSVALDIAKGLIDVSDKEVLVLFFEMTADPQKLLDNHTKQAEIIAEKLDAGLDVAFPCLGDIAVYSTFEYVAEILRAKGYPVATVPGVTSFCAVASVLERSLTVEMKQPLHIIPGSFEDMDAALAMPGTKVIMKSARKFPQVREKILSAGLAASAVVDCGMETQRKFEDIADMPENVGYFTTVIVGKKK